MNKISVFRTQLTRKIYSFVKGKNYILSLMLVVGKEMRS